MQLTYKAPCAKLEKLETLWLQLSNVACNIKCKHCYLDCHQDIRKRNFLTLDKISDALNSNLKSLQKINLTGGEPFLHPKLVDILKLSLKIRYSLKISFAINSPATLGVAALKSAT